MIEAGGSYLLESDAGINDLYYTNAIDNAGTIRKTGGTGTSTLAVVGQLINTGTIEADSGTLLLSPTSFSQLSGSTLTGGTWNALDGATLEFPTRHKHHQQRGHHRPRRRRGDDRRPSPV